MYNLHQRTWAEVDLDAIRHNYNVIKNATNANICCVIKADGYGHGAVALSKTYEQLGAKFFGVSSIEEALQLRNNGVATPILILGYTPVKDVALLASQNISQCVYSLDYAKMLQAQCITDNVKIKIHIKIDTGMSRIGFYFQDIHRDINAIGEIKTVCNMPEFLCEGIFTHFAIADEGNDTFTNKQLFNFTTALEHLRQIDFKIIHCANSGAIEDFPNTHFNMVRAGIILYGLSPSGSMRNNLDIKPALSLKSIVSHIKTVEKGSCVSYGGTFIADNTVKIATVPIGYADGYSRIISQKDGCVLIHGKRYKIIGKICMDQLMVLIDDNSNINIGDVVTLIGKDKTQTITADELAQKTDTINYEIVCDIGTRVPRVYYSNGKIIDTINYILK